ncbi:MAG: hypothetical protein L3J23_02865 [Flavobacteriaceae bacterium]|nr:hypothetical protein [Flavobacteriaceae bacterium]
MIIIPNLKQRVFFLVFTVNIILYGLVYFYPFNENGEPYIPIYYKLLLDILFIVSFLLLGIKNKINHPQFYFLLFLLSAFFIGLFHIHHTSLENYLHYTIRNVIFYSFFFYINIFSKIDYKKFHLFHEKLFKIILFFGITLFILKVLHIPNPFGLKAWMWEKNRLISTFLNPNSLGFYMVFYLLYFFFKDKKITIYSIFIMATIFLSGSLTAIIGVVMFVLYVILYSLSKKKLNFKYIIVFLILFPFLINIAYQSGIFEYIWFKIDVLFIHKTKVHTSVSTRVQNLKDLYEYFSINNIPSILLGDFKTTEYRRLDSQYLNIFYNYGLIGFLLYIISQLSLFIYMLKGKTYYTKAFILFSIWLLVIAFNLTAYLYRTNVVVFYLIILRFIMHLENKVTDKRFLYVK